MTVRLPALGFAFAALACALGCERVDAEASDEEVLTALRPWADASRPNPDWCARNWSGHPPDSFDPVWKRVVRESAAHSALQNAWVAWKDPATREGRCPDRPDVVSNSLAGPPALDRDCIVAQTLHYKGRICVDGCFPIVWDCTEAFDDDWDHHE